MALNRLNAKVVSRSKGHSVIRGAAYNARTRLKDDRTSEITSYRNKGGLEWEGIFTPKDAPAWAKDRERLWNEVEKREDQSKHRDSAQLARSYIISLPHELNDEQRRWLVTDFAREMSRKGMVVDACIHRPDRDDRNYHVHMLVTMRQLNENGFGNKVREWNQKEQLEKTRERWSELGAKALHRAGFHLEAERYAVGHLTLKEQRKAALERGDTEHAKALDREPTRSLGAAAAAMERRGHRTVSGDLNRDIDERNYARNVTKDLGREMTNGKHAHPMLKRSMVKGVDLVLDGVASALDSLISPKLTPAQQRQADEVRVQRSWMEMTLNCGATRSAAETGKSRGAGGIPRQERTRTTHLRRFELAAMWALLRQSRSDHRRTLIGTLNPDVTSQIVAKDIGFGEQPMSVGELINWYLRNGYNIAQIRMMFPDFFSDEPAEEMNWQWGAWFHQGHDFTAEPTHGMDVSESYSM